MEASELNIDELNKYKSSAEALLQELGKEIYKKTETSKETPEGEAEQANTDNTETDPKDDEKGETINADYDKKED